MANKVFCVNCGAAYDEGVSYCPMCGVSTSRQFVKAFTRAPQAHCTVCGMQTGPRDTYCTACGTECGEYIPGSGGGASIKLGIDVNFASGAKNFVPELSKAKDKTVYMPAIVFAVVAVAAGLILSLIVDMILANKLREVMGSFVSGESSIGMITLWLLSCFGGATSSLTVPGGESQQVTTTFGLVILFVIPIAALIAARFARRAFIDSQYPGKKLTLIDSLLSGGIFAVINVILSFIPPSTLAESREFVRSYYGESARVSAGSLIIPLFLFSLVTAFIISLPSIREALNSIGEKKRTVGLSCAAGVRFVRDALLCGLVATFVFICYSLIHNGGESLQTFEKVALVIVLPNLAVWGASFLTGGSLQLGQIGSSLGLYGNDAGVNAFGSIQSGEASSYGWTSYGGILLLIVGLMIAVTAVYKLLRNERLDAPKVAGVVAVPAVLMWIVSACAGYVVTYKENSSPMETMEVTTALFLNLILCAAFMAIAVGVVHLAKKNQQLDDIVAKFATTPIMCGATAVATLITCLTVAGK